MAEADRDAVLRARKRVPPPGGALLEDTEKMKQKHHRMLCAFCALVILVSTVFQTAAFAEQPVDAAAAEQTLTRADAAEMQQADAAVTVLTESEQYQEMDTDARKDAALAQLDTLAAKGLVEKDSIYTDEENGMVSFRYPCGVLGGILLTEPEDETLDEENAETETASSDHALPLRLPPDLGAEMQKSRAALLRRTENQAVEKFGTAVIYYAFDNTINSSRFPYYSYMQGFWEGMGLRTTMNTRVTLSDLRRMNKYDLCILSAHGAYYTYSYGTFRKHTRTEPIILLTEASTLYKDIIYGFDLLAHRIIKLNGLYCVTADFFRNAYRSGQLSNTIIYSETCEFLGVTNSVDESMAEALLAGGARTVLGYVNNVYTVYSRSMLWDTVNHLAMGQTIGRALAHAKDTYGENDIIWYTEQGGRRPHAAAAYLVLYGDENARLNVPENFSLEERAEAAEDMLADVLESAA